MTPRQEKPVARVERPAPRVAYGETQAKRMIVAPRDFADTSPFLRMPEDWFAAPAGFPTHPHRGMQTVTIVLDGALAHNDHTGSASVLQAGDVQWMTAGRGVLHSELPHGTAPVHLLQLWLNLPAALKMGPASYVNQRLADTPERAIDGGRIRVYAGRSGTCEHAHGSTWPMALLDIALDAGARYVHDIDLAERTFAYVLGGSGRFGDQTPVTAGDVVWFTPRTGTADDAGTITIEAQTALRVILFSSAIIDEPIVANGPFVMNTHSEIERAYDDLREGRFVAP
jgi:quercetin 2,3-dioxygenase